MNFKAATIANVKRKRLVKAVKKRENIKPDNLPKPFILNI